MALFGKKKSKASPSKASLEPAEAALDDPFGDGAPEAETQPLAAPAPPPKKPVVPKVNVPPDVYTAMLGTAALAMGIAALLLFLNIYLQGSSPI